MERARTRFLPKAVSLELRRLPWRLLGLSLVAVATAGWLALISWSYADPSASYAAQLRPSNWLGATGANAAQALMEDFGLAAPFLLLPVAAFGIQVAMGYLPRRPRLAVILWVVASLALPAFFAVLPIPSRWLLSGGLGGIVGDVLAGLLGRFSALLPAALLWPLSGLVFLTIGGWSILRACGLRVGDLGMAFSVGSAQGGGAAEFKPTFSEPLQDRLVKKVTSWRVRLPATGRALTATGKRPREFWMTEAKRPRPFPPAKPNAVRSSPPAPAQAAKSNAPSPFANWGGRVSAAETEPKVSQLEDNNEAEEQNTESLFDDVRIEPFFGPRHRTTGGSDDGPSSPEPSPLLRLASKAAEAANTNAQRLFINLSQGMKSRKPIISADPVRARLDAPVEDDGDDVAENQSSVLPPLSLLSAPPPGQDRPRPGDPAMMQRAAMLMSVLGDFGVKGRMAGIYPGPVITLFELEPARGTKSSRVVGLADDIARSMSAVSARIATVPGRDAIGIELPNPNREIVSLRGILETPLFQGTQAVLPLALGKSIGGEPVVADLARMPHLLIAGTTGSGKSVAINTMILSLLFRLPPAQCNFIMIDPKMLELSAYDGIPHLLAPVVTDPKKAVCALKWTVKEMNTRYDKMSKLGVRNIMSYNAKVAAAQLRGQPLKRVVQTGFHLEGGEPFEEEEVWDAVSMPYIVVVIDEMADLMMVAGKDIEFAVQRLSQMARAAGIHLIMATQRPSVDVVTGTIKANFPSRISFQVTSKIDSRTIIGEQGAEQLLGAGDMLYMAAGGRIIRAHGPFVSDDEVEAVTRHLKAQGFPCYRDDILEDTGGFADDVPVKQTGSARDLYDQAVEIVLKDRKPTTSYLQRRLGIGYNRAASLIERMEQDGIIGAANRTGRREILSDAP